MTVAVGAFLPPEEGKEALETVWKGMYKHRPMIFWDYC